MSEVYVIGVCRAGLCGVHDQAVLLADAMREAGVETDVALDRASGRRSSAGAGLRVVRRAWRTPRTATVLWNYSPFTHSVGPVPFVGVAAGLVARARGARVVTFAHELAYDWSRARGASRLVAAMHRVALAVVLLGSDAVIVTTEARAEAVRRLPWPLRRPTVVRPVASNLPVVSPPTRSDSSLRIGVFGYTGDGIDADLVLGSLRRAISTAPLRLVLIGGPGPTEGVRRTWQIHDRSLPVDVSGILSPDDLAAEIASCDVILHANLEGPSARKTTLAAALAAGRPIVAIDGPNRWSALLHADAIRLVAADEIAIADAIVALAGDATARAALGRRAQEFYRSNVDVRAHLPELLQVIAGDGLHIAFLVNRGGNMERRANDLAKHLPAHVRATIVVEPGFARAWRTARRATVAYVIDPGKHGFPAAVAARLALRPVIVELGDPQAALYRAQGRGPVAAISGAMVDRIVARHASGVVVRGRRLAETLDVRVPSVELPDGVDLDTFRPMARDSLRRDLGIPEEAFVAGLVGALKLSGNPGRVYGWDLIDAAAVVNDTSMWILVVGDGNGVEWLRARARAAGVADRLVLSGRVPHGDVPRHINAMDVCVSTQSNDVIGRGRTTAKLPEYLACDRHVLATAVGGAVDVLPDPMLVPIDGAMDPAYPARLAERIAALMAAGDRELEGRAGTRALAERFSYPVLADRLMTFITTLTSHRA